MEENNVFESKEFKVSIGAKIFYGVFAAILFVFSIGSVVKGTASSNAYIWLFSALCTLGGILLIIAFQTRKLLLNEGSILYIGLFSNKEFEFSNIKGYRLHPKMIDIECFDGAKLTLYFYYDFSNCAEIVNWLRLKFEDLDAQNLQNETDTFLKNERFGFTEQGRSGKLKTARELSLAYNIWGAIAGFIFIFFDQRFTFIILMIIPLLGIALLYSSSLIRFFSEKNQSIYPFIYLGFGVPSIGLIFKTADYSLINSGSFWLPLIFYCALIFVLIFYKGINRTGSYILSETIITIILVVIYGFGSFRAVNCTFDNSNVQFIKVEVLGKKLRHGKGTYYGLVLNKWGSQTEVSKEKVSSKMFHRTNIGDMVIVKLKKGFLNVPWYVLDTEL